MRIIIARGMEIVPEGIDLKHNETLRDAPRSPIKLHLCTPDLRKKACMTVEDMRRIVRMFWQYIEHRHLAVPALGGIPRVGEAFAFMLQRHVYEQTGRYIPVVRAEKIYHSDGTREIGRIIHSAEYPTGDLWLIDDVVNWGRSKFEALNRYTQAGYRITDSLVAVDYGVNAAALFAKLHGRLHSLLPLDSILMLGTREKSLDLGIIAQTKAYLAASRLANTELPDLGRLVNKTA